MEWALRYTSERRQFGQTVLSRSVQAAGLDWDESEAHSAVYDTEKTAALFCAIVNRWKILTGF